MPNLANIDYVERINRAIDFVVNHLAEPIRLEDVARAAAFSPFHFHRIFRGLMGETLANFIKRVRLERAAQLMARRPDASITEVALACGFSSSSDFSRSFRKHYRVSPRDFDIEAMRNSQRQSLQDTVSKGFDGHRLARLPAGKNPDGFSVELRKLPPRRVAYIRVHSPYAGDGVPRAAERLISWARDRGLEGGQWLGYQWEDPDIVPLEHCRYDVGVEVPPGTAGGGEVGTYEFEAMLVAELAISGSIDLEQRALDWLLLTWLPHSGYAPANQPTFEAWRGLPFAHGMHHFELRLLLPIADGATPL